MTTIILGSLAVWILVGGRERVLSYIVPDIIALLLIFTMTILPPLFIVVVLILRKGYLRAKLGSCLLWFLFIVYTTLCVGLFVIDIVAIGVV